MECSVTIQGLPLFQYASPASRPAEACAAPCQSGVLCPSARRAGGCLLPAAVGPVIEAFSSVISHEQVLLVLRDGGETAVLEETGQRAAFRLLLAAMGGSGCPFFGRALPAGSVPPRGEDSYGTFRRMVRRMTVVRQTDGAAGRLADPSLARCGRDIEAHLDPILAEARRRRRQDAALNAVILMYSCTRLALEETREARAARLTAA